MNTFIIAIITIGGVAINLLCFFEICILQKQITNLSTEHTAIKNAITNLNNIVIDFIHADLTIKLYEVTYLKNEFCKMRAQAIKEEKYELCSALDEAIKQIQQIINSLTQNESNK